MLALVGHQLWQDAAARDRKPTPRPSLDGVAPLPLETETGRLPDLPAAQDATASIRRNPGDSRARADLTITLRSAPGMSRAPGIGVMDSVSGTLHGWRSTAGLDRLVFPDLPAGEHWLVLARAPRECPYAYLRRQPLAWQGQDTEPLELDVSVHEVMISIEGMPPESTTLVPILSRPDDPSWHDPRPVTLPVLRGRQIRLEGMGAGTYRLRVDGLVDADPLEFEVPSEEPLRLRLPRTPR